MLSSLGTKVALKRIGLPSNAFDFSSFENAFARDPDHVPKKLRKDPPWLKPEPDQLDSSWPSWIPLSVQPWLPTAPSIAAVAQLPHVGDIAPKDRDGRLRLGGRNTLVVFLRCAGCAFGQEMFLHLRTLANRFHSSIRCVAVSHASEAATKKWIDLMGGAWNVEVLVDEERLIYAAWGLGESNAWHVLNPTSQMQAWKQKGWLGSKVADAMDKKNEESHGEDNLGIMGSKWQEAGAFAIDAKGTVVWGGKALRADDLMNLDEGVQILQL